MSRTDAHAPLWVRLARGELAVEAYHAADHADCDLPPRPPFEGGHAGHRATRCHWVFRYTGVGVCSCWMCHGGSDNRRLHRRERQSCSIELRTAAKQWRHDDHSAFDEMQPRRPRRYW